jgi:hypothetical protein
MIYIGGRDCQPCTAWPANLRPIRDQLPRESGTPRLLIVRDDRVVSNRFGGTGADSPSDLKRILGE